MNKNGATTMPWGILALVVIVIGAIFLFTQEDAIPAITPPGEKEIIPGLCEEDTVTVSFTDIKSALRTGTSADNDVNLLKINGNEIPGFTVETDQTLTYGDNYTAYYLSTPTAGAMTAGTDYYGTVVTGVIDDCGKDYVSARPYLASSLTLWVNNDPSNATTRNGPAAQEAYSAGTSLIPTLHMQVSSQYGAFGISPNATLGDLENKGILVYIDHNGSEVTLEPAASQIKTSGVSCPPAHAVSADGGDANVTTCNGWELSTYQLSGIGTTLSLPIAVTASSTEDPKSDMNIYVEDADMFVRTDGVYEIGWYDDISGGVGVAAVTIPYYMS